MNEEKRKQKIRENAKRYYQKNKEKILARQKKYVRERYKKDEEYRKRTLENHKRYEENNKEKVKEIKRNAQRKYYEKHKDYYKEKCGSWYKKKCDLLQSKIDKVIKLCETEKKYYIYDYAGRDEKTGKLLKGNKIELDVVNKSKILDILREDK